MKSEIEKYFMDNPTMGMCLLITTDYCHNIMKNEIGYKGKARNGRDILITNNNLLIDVKTGIGMSLLLYDEYLKKSRREFDIDYDMYTKPILNEFEKLKHFKSDKKVV